MKGLRHTLRIGLSFGLTSGVITTLGLLVGLYSGTHSRLAITAGILTIALADSLSDAVGIHLSEESEGIHSGKEVWESTFFTFMFKAFFTMSFIPPVLFLDLFLAVITSIIWGILLVSLLSYAFAKEKSENPLIAIGEHVAITLTVVILTYYMGELIGKVLS
ncbi:MAG: hypothetical protein DRJ41_00815 [Thermoprotei archaeon]|nr:MAG: hypothetical protein DRJ41_00815 [Thermoprotei archaeon]